MPRKENQEQGDGELWVPPEHETRAREFSEQVELVKNDYPDANITVTDLNEVLARSFAKLSLLFREKSKGEIRRKSKKRFYNLMSKRFFWRSQQSDIATSTKSVREIFVSTNSESELNEIKKRLTILTKTYRGIDVSEGFYEDVKSLGLEEEYNDQSGLPYKYNAVLFLEFL